MSCTLSPLPAREAVHCVSFSKHCVAEEVSDVPLLLCMGQGWFSQVASPSKSFNTKVLSKSVSVTSVDVLGTKTKDWKGLKVQIPGKYCIWRVNFTDRACFQIGHEGSIFFVTLFCQLLFSFSQLFWGRHSSCAECKKPSKDQPESGERLWELTLSQLVCCPFSWCVRHLLC